MNGAFCEISEMLDHDGALKPRHQDPDGQGPEADPDPPRKKFDIMAHGKTVEGLVVYQA